MKNYLLKISGAALLGLLLHVPGFAQQPKVAIISGDTSFNRLKDYDEIIIKRKGDKNTKVTVEIKDGQVLIDGKPVDEYNNDELSVRKRKTRVLNGQTFTYSSPDGYQSFVMPVTPEMPEMPEVPEMTISPFRGQSGNWNFDGGILGENSNRAMLGVTSEKAGGDEKGAKIKVINKASAAEKAGLHLGDVITRIDEVTIEGPESLSEAIHKYKPEDKVTVTFKREGKEQKVTAALGKMKVQSFAYSSRTPNGDTYNFRGMTRPDTYLWDSRRQARLGIKAQDTEDGKGVKVLDVDDESAAEKAGIKEGDIITKFDGKDVNSAAELAEGAKAGKEKSSFKVNFLRDGKAQEVEVKIPRKLKTADL